MAKTLRETSGRAAPKAGVTQGKTTNANSETACMHSGETGRPSLKPVSLNILKVSVRQDAGTSASGPTSPVSPTHSRTKPPPCGPPAVLKR